MSPVLEGLDSGGLCVGTSPPSCGLLASWGEGGAQLGEDQSEAPYSVHPSPAGLRAECPPGLRSPISGGF